MKIAMIDPSLFTLPYDTALCDALLANGADVTLHGRRLRAMEPAPAVMLRPSFYRRSETLRAVVPDELFHLFKGLEHATDMATVVRTFRRERPSVVHFQWLPVPAIDRIAVRRIRRSIGPVVLTVHDITPFNDSPISRLQGIGSRAIWREFDHLIVHSESSRSLLIQRGLSNERISVIPHGILNVAPARRRPLGADAPLTILLFGRIKHYKGIDVMIEALGRLPASLRQRFKVLIVGEPMIPIEPIKQRAMALGVAEDIIWDLRYVSEAEMGEIFSRTDVFAFPYREIDTSGVLMSCLPYGKPIIASASGAFSKLLRDGIHGRIVPPKDPGALAEAIGSLLADPVMLATCGCNVMQLSGCIPTWDAIAGQTMALYAKLASKSEKSASATITGSVVAA